MQSLKISSSGCLAAVNNQKIFSRKTKTFIFNNSLSTFSCSKTLILKNSLSHSQTPRSFSVAAVPTTPTVSPLPPTAESLVHAIESSQRLFIEHLAENIDPSILSSPLPSTDLTKALDCFYSIKEKRVLPNIQFDEFIRHMETLAGMKPSIFTYTKGNKLEVACVIFMTTKDVGLFRDGFSYNHFSFVTCKEGKLEEPSDLLPQMLELGLVPHSLTYDALIHGCAIDRSHDMYKAIEYKDEMISRGIEPSLFTYNLLLDALFEGGYSCEALDVIEEMQEKGVKPDVDTYNIMVSGFFKCKYDGESFIYEEMVERRIQPTLVTYNNVMLGYCSVGEKKEAQEIFDEMKERGIKPDHISYNLLIAGYSSDFRGSANLKEAFRIRDEMLKNGFHPTITTYEALILGLSQNNEFEHAQELLKEMVSKGICTPDDITYRSLKKIIGEIGEGPDRLCGGSNNLDSNLTFQFLLEVDKHTLFSPK